jgi:hypothetical protein
MPSLRMCYHAVVAISSSKVRIAVHIGWSQRLRHRGGIFRDVRNSSLLISHEFILILLGTGFIGYGHIAHDYLHSTLLLSPLPQFYTSRLLAKHHRVGVGIRQVYMLSYYGLVLNTLLVKLIRSEHLVALIMYSNVIVTNFIMQRRA